MTNIFRPIAAFCMTALLMTSCLGDDTTEVTYYGDTAITAFSLGTLNRYLTTKSTAGEDSTYKETYAGSSYKFYIDQMKNEIYNTDSLPTLTDTAHVICSVTSKNSGLVVINFKNSEGADSLAYYSSADSVDFSKVNDFRVYSTDGNAYRKYSVKVNVHKEEADSFTWRPAADAALTCAYGMKAVCFGGRMWLFTSDGTATTAYTAELGNHSTWTPVSGVSLDADAYASVTVYNKGTDTERLCTLSGGTVMLSDDGVNWSDARSLNGTGDGIDMASLKRIIGADSLNIYALTGNGIATAKASMVWNWKEDETSADNSDMLPTADVTAVTMPLKTNSKAQRVVMTGNCYTYEADADTHQTDTVAVVWNKIVEHSHADAQHTWTLNTEDNHYELPRLQGLVTVAYGDAIVALGGDGKGKCTKEGFKQLYVSEDNGLTWHANSSYPLPDDFSNGGSNVFTMAVDTDNYLWIISGGTGKAWRGRLNKLGWTSEQTSFLK